MPFLGDRLNKSRSAKAVAKNDYYEKINAMRKSIKAGINWHKIQEIEHTP